MKNSFVSQLCSKVIHYYSHHYYKLTPTTFEKVTPTNKIKVLIVARQHYLERQIRLPITLKKDVKAAMAFEMAELQQSFHVFYKITAVIDGVSHITLWQIPHDIVPESAILVLPESYLFYQTIKTGKILHYATLLEKKSVFIAKTQNTFQSMVENSGQLSMFSQATGVSLEQAIYIESKDFPSQLLSAFIASMPAILAGFWCSHRDKQDVKAQIKPFAVPTVAVLLTYLLLSSAFISLRYDNVLSQVNEQKNDIDQVLTIQSEINTLEQELEKYSSLAQTGKPLWNVWIVLAPLFDQNITFKFVRYSGKDIFFSAYAPSATNVLESILDMPEVDSASFTTAVRKKDDNEEFIIKFSLTDETVKVEGSVNEK